MTMKVMCKAVQWKDEYAVEIEAEDKASAARLQPPGHAPPVGASL